MNESYIDMLNTNPDSKDLTKIQKDLTDKTLQDEDLNQNQKFNDNFSNDMNCNNDQNDMQIMTKIEDPKIITNDEDNQNNINTNLNINDIQENLNINDIQENLNENNNIITDTTNENNSELNNQNTNLLDINDKSEINQTPSDNSNAINSSSDEKGKENEITKSKLTAKLNRVDILLNRLLASKARKSKIKTYKDTILSPDEVKFLCQETLEILKDQPCFLSLETPLTVCGDLHGQFFDLIRIFELNGFPPKRNYLFLGDYVDRGKQGVETLCLLFCYKIKYKNNFFLMRGNHESATMNEQYGFYNECKRKYDTRLWKKFVNVFNYLPFTAILEDQIIFMHGGISKDLDNLEQLKQIWRPTDIPDKGLLCDLLWSDPEDNEEGWKPNDRGVSYVFNQRVIEDFLNKHNLKLIVRAHQVVQHGYEFYARKKLVTIFSAPNYCGEYDNAGAVLNIDKNLVCSIKIIYPDILSLNSNK